MSRLKEKIEGLKRQMQFLKEMQKQVEAVPGNQVSLTDPDARSMATSGKGTGIAGYNVHMALDSLALERSPIFRPSVAVWPVARPRTALSQNRWPLLGNSA